MAYRQTPASYKQIQLLYYFLFAGQVFMGGVIFFLMQDVTMEREVVSPFNFIIPGAVVFGMVAAYLLGQKNQNDIPVKGSIKEKLEHYRRACIPKYALAQGGNLISLMLTFTMANTSSLIWFAMGLATFILLRPSRDRFMEQYQVSPNEGFE